MRPPKKYMAASVPRFLRQTKLGHLPLSCVLGSRSVGSGMGNNMVFDIVMLPPPEFQRMRTSIGLQHVMAPKLAQGSTFAPAFVLADIKEVIVPPEEPEPENFARNHFMREFGLIDAASKAAGPESREEAAAPSIKDSPFSKTAKENTVKGRSDKNKEN